MKCRKTILCVDDETSVLSSLKRLFRKTEFDIVIANNGNEALGILDQHAVDLVISDMRMPNMDGSELLTQIADKWPATKKILLTGYSDLESEEKTYLHVPDVIRINKPWSNDALIASVRSLLK